MIDRRGFAVLGVPVRLKWLALGWIAAEVLVFMLLVQTIGLGATVLLGLGTTLVGVMMLRRLGAGALATLRVAAMEGRQPREGHLLDGLLAGLGALLLIVPGFIANFVGLAMASPSIRRKAVSLVSGDGPATRLRCPSTEVVDLGPSDWRAVDGS